MPLTQSTKKIYITVVVLVALVALLLGYYVSQISHAHALHKPDLTQFSGTLLKTPRAIDEFNLTGTTTTNYSNANLLGHWTMIFFGFTNCPALCPMTMTELAKMYQQLQADKVQNLPEVVFISLDPARDSIAKVKHYVTAFDSHFIGAVGDIAKIDKMTVQLGIASIKVSNASNAADYTIQHTGTIIVVNPQGEVVAYLSLPHVAAQMAKDYEILAG